MVVFIKCGTNNRAATVYELFQKAVDRFGLPSRGENYLVARCMIGEGMLTGSSTHNQVDMYRSVTIVYYSTIWNSKAYKAY